MARIKRHLAFHLTVLTLVVAAVVVATVAEGLGLGLIVAIAGFALLAAGIPVAVMVEEQGKLPFLRR